MTQHAPNATDMAGDESQPLQLSSKRKVGDAEIDITPMIDCVFLLLIFFLVASKMDESATVPLPPARHGVEVAQENAIIVIIRKLEGEEVQVLRRDGRPFSNDLASRETEIGEYVEAGLAGTEPFDHPMDTIIIKAQGEVKAGEVAQVAEAIGKATEIPELNYAVLQEQ
ncbi:MAG: biopolymer transporter ExbD [Planctomycetes bacterium]|nr:biopolymer transporter ExbD [Planctomycetota bacterium]